MSPRIAVVGGGAAGFFGAIAAATSRFRRAGSEVPGAEVPGARNALAPANGLSAAEVHLFEAAGQPLQKVRISGGGRCNVTHHCFEPRDLVKGYPRGARELLGPFTRFGPRETVAWFEERGVRLKAEADGRMFPVTDRSATVVDCLVRAAQVAGVRLRLGAKIKNVSAAPGSQPGFDIDLADHTRERFDRVLLATGGNPAGYRLAASLGHTIVPCVPSLFTFNVQDPRLAGLAGISFDKVALTLSGGASKALKETGPLLITHWGLSGPAVLKLSAWGARMLAECAYRAALTVNFLPDAKPALVQQELLAFKAANGRKRIVSARLFGIPTRYWSRLVHHAGIADDMLWSNLSTKALAALISELMAARFAISGKGVFKEEFVTCGGVKLSEVDFKTMESKVMSGLYLAGEILDIDGITGGFNFQSAWTTGWLAGEGMAVPRA